MEEDENFKLKIMEELIKTVNKICREDRQELLETGSVGNEAVDVLKALFQQLLPMSENRLISSQEIINLENLYINALSILMKKEAINELQNQNMAFKDFNYFMRKFLEKAVIFEKFELVDFIMEVNKFIAKSAIFEHFLGNAANFMDWEVFKLYVQKGIFERELLAINERNDRFYYESSKKNLKQAYKIALEKCFMKGDKLFFDYLFRKNYISVKDVENILLFSIASGDSLKEQEMLEIIKYFFKEKILSKNDKNLIKNILFKFGKNKKLKIVDYIFSESFIDKENKEEINKYFLKAAHFEEPDLILYFIEKKIVDPDDKFLMEKAFLKTLDRCCDFSETFEVEKRETISCYTDTHIDADFSHYIRNKNLGVFKVIDYFINNQLVNFSENWFEEIFQKLLYPYDGNGEFFGECLIIYLADRKLVKIDEKLTQELICQAIKLGSVNLAAYFQSQGGSLELPNKRGETATHLVQYVRDENFREIIDMELDNIDFFQKDNQGLMPLHHAALSGSLKNYKNVMEETFSPQSKKSEKGQFKKAGSDELRIIHFASMAPRKELLVYLIKKNGEKLVNILDNKGRSPLHHAVLAKRLENVMFLCGSEYVNIDLKDKSGKTPMDLAKELGKNGRLIVKCLKIHLKDKATDISEVRNGFFLPSLKQNHRSKQIA